MADASTIARGLYGIAGGFRAIGMSIAMLAQQTKDAAGVVIGSVDAIKQAQANLVSARDVWNPSGASRSAAPPSGGSSDLKMLDQYVEQTIDTGG